VETRETNKRGQSDKHTIQYVYHYVVSTKCKRVETRIALKK